MIMVLWENHMLMLLMLMATCQLTVGRIRRSPPGKRCPAPVPPVNGRVNNMGRAARYSCLEGFILHGSSMSFCRGNTWIRSPPACIKAGCPSTLKVFEGDNLSPAPVREAYGGALMSFHCPDRAILIGPAELLCDGTQWRPTDTGPMCTLPRPVWEVSCDFETDWCRWQNVDGVDDFNWVMRNRSTPTGDTGPAHDHTYGKRHTGHFIFAESSFPQSLGDRAELRSPVLPSQNSEACISYFYHMYGRFAVGLLEAFVVPANVSVTGIDPQFSRLGNQGSSWKKGQFYIKQMETSFQVVFVVTRNISYFSDIAIDDVTILPGQCTDIPATTNPPPETTGKIITTRKAVTTRKPISATRMATTTVTKATTRRHVTSKAPIRVTVTSSPGRRITSTTDIPPRPEEEKRQRGKLPLILGAVIGGMVLIVMVTVITWFVVKKLRAGRIIDGMSPIGTDPYDDDTISEDL